MSHLPLISKADSQPKHAKGSVFFFQPKLSINQPGDAYEQEADAMADKVMRMPGPPSQHNTFFQSAITPVQRTCAHCEEEDEKKVQRKESDAVPQPLAVTENYIHSIQGGNPLNVKDKAFFESRMGHDFSNVRLHTDSAAATSAQSINALAYTTGNNIVFNKGQHDTATDSGKKLLAHELTHVIQQTGSRSGIVRRKTPPKKTAIELEEENLRTELKAIRTAVDAAQPGDKAAATRINELITTFQKDFARYKPSQPLFWTEPEHGETDYWRYNKVFSKSEMKDLSARLWLIGMQKGSRAIYDFGKPQTMVGVFPLDPIDQFNKDYTRAALERVDMSTPGKTTSSLDLLLMAFNHYMSMVTRRDMKKVEADKKYADIYGSPEKAMEIGFLGEWPYYLSLMGHLGKLYAGMQRIVQHHMDKVFEELSTTGQAPSMVEVFNVLRKMEVTLNKEAKFSNPLSADKAFFNPGKSIVAVTKTEFSKKGGLHKDMFDTGKKAPSVKIEFYDKDQKEGTEKFIPIEEVHKIRYIQLNFIRSFYGLDDKGKTVTTKKGQPTGILKAGQHFNLFSLEEWKEFLDAKFDDLVTNQKQNTANAFLTIIRLLESYLKAFTIHTPFNIEDKGDNYLTKTFPRALTGQLIHDCGVYALKIVYLLSLLSTRLKLKIQFIMLPNHVGLIIKGDQTPVLMVHNDDFNVIPVSEAQFDSLSKENQRTVMKDDEIKEYEKAKKSGDTSRFKFSLDKQKQDWLDFTKKEKIGGPITDDQFLAEKAANRYLNQVDMPFALVNINPKDFDPRQKNEAIKKKLWSNYQEMVRNTEFFDKAATNKEFSETYQFHLRYLNLTVAERNFHNNVLLPYWNLRAYKNWIKLVADLKAPSKANDKATYIKLLQAYKAEFVKGSNEVTKAFAPMDAQKASIHEIITTGDPKPLKAGTQKTVGKRSPDEVWRVAFQSHLDSINQRINNLQQNKEELVKGIITDITPAFETASDLLQYIP